MGQAAVDLPDPMQSPAAPATTGTDDLLAQLAGDEIERLLAETETERPATPAPSAPSPANSSPAVSATASDPLTGLPATADIAQASAIEPDAKEDLTSQLDALFDSVNGTAAPAAPAVAPAIEPPVAPPAPPAPAAAAKAPDSASSSAELKALGEPMQLTDAADTAALADSLEIGEAADEESRPSLLVRILEWINSPLGQCSDPVRQAVGKIAIATLLNAIAVLAYTLVFRHR